MSDIESKIEDALIDAEWDERIRQREAERKRRAELSPRQKRLQAALDDILAKVDDWNAANPGSVKGNDHIVLWAAVHGLAELHREGGSGRAETRWLASWVENQLIAAINTQP